MLPEWISEEQFGQLAEPLQKEYKKANDGANAGKYRLDSDAVGKLDQIRGTADAAQRTAGERQKELEQARAQLAALEELGGLDTVREALDKQRKAEEERMKAEGTATERVRELEKAVKAKDDELVAARKKADEDVRKYAARTELLSELGKLNVDPEVAPIIADRLMGDLKINGRREGEGEGAKIIAVGEWQGVPRPLSEVMEAWGETPVAKRVRLAPDSAGGGDPNANPRNPGGGGDRTTVDLNDEAAVASNWDALVQGKVSLQQ